MKFLDGKLSKPILDHTGVGSIHVVGYRLRFCGRSLPSRDLTMKKARRKEGRKERKKERKQERKQERRRDNKIYKESENQSINQRKKSRTIGRQAQTKKKDGNTG